MIRPVERCNERDQEWTSMKSKIRRLHAILERDIEIGFLRSIDDCLFLGWTNIKLVFTL